MAVSTSGGVACRLSYRRMVDILNTSSTSCRHLYSTRGDQKVLQLTVIESIFNEIGFFTAVA